MLIKTKEYADSSDDKLHQNPRDAKQIQMMKKVGVIIMIQATNHPNKASYYEPKVTGKEGNPVRKEKKRSERQNINKKIN